MWIQIKCGISQASNRLHFATAITLGKPNDLLSKKFVLSQNGDRLVVRSGKTVTVHGELVEPFSPVKTSLRQACVSANPL